MKHEQKSAELEEFLEQEIKKLEHESSRTSEDPSDIIWDAAEAAVALGKAKDLTEAANAVINSDAFAHLTDELVVIPRQAPEPKTADGMVSDFQADSALAIEFEEGDQGGQGAGDAEAEEGYLFSAVTPDHGLHVEEEGDIFGGGKPPDDDDTNKDRGSREPKKKPAKKKKAEADKTDKAKKAKADKAGPKKK